MRVVVVIAILVLPHRKMCAAMSIISNMHRHTHTYVKLSQFMCWLEFQCILDICQDTMGAHNKNLRTALGLTAFAFILILLAFVSPYWLVFDGKMKNPKFLNLGTFNLYESAIERIGGVDTRRGSLLLFTVYGTVCSGQIVT